jgi:hypothetical protein
MPGCIADQAHDREVGASCRLLSTTVVGIQHGWQRFYEAFCRCRHCSRTTTFGLAQKNSNDGDALNKNPPEKLPGSINNYFEHNGYVSQKDEGATEPPEHVPPDLAKIFAEATKCVAVHCWNAAGAMFRLCVDMTTEPLVPEVETAGLNSHTRRNLGPRVEWLFNNGKLPAQLFALSNCIREDGNDAAHRGAR